jgi:hypothetical protein
MGAATHKPVRPPTARRNSRIPGDCGSSVSTNHVAIAGAAPAIHTPLLYPSETDDNGVSGRKDSASQAIMGPPHKEGNIPIAVCNSKAMWIFPSPIKDIIRGDNSPYAVPPIVIICRCPK